MDDEQPTVQLSLVQLQSSVDLGFERVQGQLGLLIQRADQQDHRAEEHRTRLDDHDRRLRDTITEQHLNDRTKNIWRVFAVLVSAIGVVVGAATTIVVALI